MTGKFGRRCSAHMHLALVRALICLGVVGVAWNCSSPSAPVALPTPPDTPAPTPMATDAAPAETEPIEPPQAPAPATPAKRWDVPGSDVGFWCHKVTQKKSRRQVGACYRAQELCERLRREGIEDDYAVTTCEPASAAHCFTLADVVGQKIYWRCFDTDENCQLRRAKYQRDQPKFEFTACSFTARRWPAKQRHARSIWVKQWRVSSLDPCLHRPMQALLCNDL